MSIWYILGIILLLILLGLIPTLVRRKRLELILGISIFSLLLISLLYILVTQYLVNYP